jgi:hypothetical protein
MAGALRRGPRRRDSGGPLRAESTAFWSPTTTSSRARRSWSGRGGG